MSLIKWIKREVKKVFPCWPYILLKKESLYFRLAYRRWSVKISKTFLNAKFISYLVLFCKSVSRSFIISDLYLVYQTLGYQQDRRPSFNYVTYWAI